MQKCFSLLYPYLSWRKPVNKTLLNVLLLHSTIPWELISKDQKLYKLNQQLLALAKKKVLQLDILTNIHISVAQYVIMSIILNFSVS